MKKMQMNKELENTVSRAVNLINTNQASCVVIKDNIIIESEYGRGVSPILKLLEEGVLRDSVVVDKVIGKAAAMIMTYAGVRICHAVTISEAALSWFKQKEVDVTYENCVPFIINRKGDGMCPMEELAMNLNDDADIVNEVKAKLESLIHTA